MPNRNAPVLMDKAYVTHGLFRDFFANNGIFADQIVALHVDPAVMDISVVFSRALPDAEASGEIEPVIGHTKIRTVRIGPMTPQPLSELAR